MIYTIATQKGGTGKTTTAAALAQAAAHKGQTALAIDLDPQGNLTYCLAADSTQPGSYDLLHGAAASSVTQTTAQGIPFLGAVRKAVAVKEAAALQLSLFEYAPKCNPAADYMSIYEQLEKREG